MYINGCAKRSWTNRWNISKINSKWLQLRATITNRMVYTLKYLGDSLLSLQVAGTGAMDIDDELKRWFEVR